MLVSILHRATGSALAIGGGVLLVWWLAALAGGEASYAKFIDIMTVDKGARLNWLPTIILIGLTWSFFQHLCSGVRHLLLDTGAGYELRANKAGALATLAISSTLSILVWGAIFSHGAL